MSARLSFLVPLFLILILVVPASCAQVAAFPSSDLNIATAGGSRHFKVELARTPEQLEQGLMYRRSLAADAGMLFEFGHVEPVTFWMKNTLIPLDMLFIAADGEVEGIHERAEPLSEAMIPSEYPVLAVLELKGGTVERLGIKPGDRVLYRLFGTAP